MNGLDAVGACPAQNVDFIVHSHGLNGQQCVGKMVRCTLIMRVQGHLSSRGHCLHIWTVPLFPKCLCLRKTLIINDQVIVASSELADCTTTACPTIGRSTLLVVQAI